jgi:hypothetical protein
MEPYANLLLLALLAVGFWWAIQPQYAFVVQIDDGSPRVARGKVTPTFLRTVQEVCGRAGVARGWVGGVRRGRRVALAFSRDFPASCQQQLRNLWPLER